MNEYKNDEPLVSVMMPTYNSAIHIADAVESVIKQTLKEWELIIVDDGSTDDTWSIISDYAQKDDRIHIYGILHGGRGVARNKCLEKVSGRYIAVCDSDDISLPERFEKQVRFLESHPDIDVVGGQICLFWGSPVCKSHNSVNWPIYHKDIAAGFRRHKMRMPNAAVMIRRRCFNEIGLYDESLLWSQDYDLLKRIYYKYGRFHNLPDVLVAYRTESRVCSLSYFYETQIYKIYVDFKHMLLFHNFDEYKYSRVYKIVRIYLFLKYVFYYVPKMQFNLLSKKMTMYL